VGRDLWKVDNRAVKALLVRGIVLAMVVLAVVVQIGVWGATKLHSNGALLQSWQPYFGWPYGMGFALAQVALCRWLAIDRGLVWLTRTWAITGAALVLLWLISGRPDRLTIESGVALTAGLGALVLAAGLYEGHLVPGTAGRERT
jgi:hypothetical protein